MRVRVLSRTKMEAGAAEGSDAVISIPGSSEVSEPQLDRAIAQATKHESARLLKLSFDDIGMAQYGHFVGPRMEQVADAIEFGRQVVDGRHFFDGPTSDPLITIHCERGKSRSAAVALALLADHFGVGFEYEAVNSLLRADHEDRMHPNPLVVDLADSCLFRYGHLNEALTELSSRYVQWRKLWCDVATDPDAHWEKARRAPERRSGD